ncbi:hypothetical protein EV401DRAFT_1882195 [Pisolithus croceorrhizus]|nr:hypothetical protein EV401DRAFT_1882195 [Pisolithus croceorrhizus]
MCGLPAWHGSGNGHQVDSFLRRSPVSDGWKNKESPAGERGVAIPNDQFTTRLPANGGYLPAQPLMFWPIKTRREALMATLDEAMKCIFAYSRNHSISTYPSIPVPLCALNEEITSTAADHNGSDLSSAGNPAMIQALARAVIGMEMVGFQRPFRCSACGLSGAPGIVRQASGLSKQGNVNDGCISDRVTRNFSKTQRPPASAPTDGGKARDMVQDGKGVGRGRGRGEEGGGVGVCGVGHFRVNQGGRRATTWIVTIVVHRHPVRDGNYLVWLFCMQSPIGTHKVADNPATVAWLQAGNRGRYFLNE